MWRDRDGVELAYGDPPVYFSARRHLWDIDIDTGAVSAPEVIVGWTNPGCPLRRPDFYVNPPPPRRAFRALVGTGGAAHYARLDTAVALPRDVGSMQSPSGNCMAGGSVKTILEAEAVLTEPPVPPVTPPLRPERN